jgi:serine/threonine protein kinase
MPDTPSTRKTKNAAIAVGYGALGGLEREDSRRNGNGEAKPLIAPSLASAAKDASSGSNFGTSSGLLTDKYVLKEVLGVGSTSTCHRCVSLATQQTFACKIIDKRHIESRFRGLLSQFNVEIDVLRELSHDGIIKLEDVYVTSEKIYMVMELCTGGELFDYVVEKGTLTEEEAAHIVRKVTAAVVYMHQKNIIHRDMKPENLLLVKRPTPGAVPSVKIIDFGLSKFLHDDPSARSFLGTRGYLAPEMLQRRDYNKAVDVWALGVIVFVLLCGCLPFDDDSTVPTDAAVKEKFVLRFPRWARNLSESAKVSGGYLSSLPFISL